MREFVLLDSGPLGHACRRPGTPGADQCLLWIDALIARGVEVVVSEIADYEVRRAGPPRHFFLSFLRFSIVTNYCTCRLYLLIMTKATANIVKRCDDVPQKLRFSPNAGFAIRPSSPILMRWPWESLQFIDPLTSGPVSAVEQSRRVARLGDRDPFRDQR